MPKHEWWDYPEDEHGDFQYTLRQFLLMYRLNLGGEWEEVTEWTRRQIIEHQWDPDDERTYRDHMKWYLLNRKTLA